MESRGTGTGGGTAAWGGAAAAAAAAATVALASPCCAGEVDGAVDECIVGIEREGKDEALEREELADEEVWHWAKSCSVIAFKCER